MIFLSKKLDFENTAIRLKLLPVLYYSEVYYVRSPDRRDLEKYTAK